jgi:hypothetical protein
MLLMKLGLTKIHLGPGNGFVVTAPNGKSFEAKCDTGSCYISSELHNYHGSLANFTLGARNAVDILSKKI